MTEPVVALTDYALFVECVLFTFLLSKSPQRLSNRWFSLFFASLGLGALLGGTVHGFFLDEMTVGHRILWPGTLLCLGVTAFAEWAIASRMVWPPRTARLVTWGAAGLLLAYGAVVLFVDRSFVVAILHYLPPSVLLLAAMVLVYRRTSSQTALIGAAGVCLAFGAAGIQVGKVALHPVYFDHNALYHLIQAVALFLIFLAARKPMWAGEPSIP